jgi:ATP-dependent Lon protease
VMAAQRDGSVGNPGKDEIYETGVLGSLIRIEPLPDGTLKALIEGAKRVRITRFINDSESFQAEVEWIVETAESGETKKLLELVASAFVSGRFKSLAANRSIYLTADGDASVIADRIASHLPMNVWEKQVLLETPNAAERLRRILAFLTATSETTRVPSS